MSADESVQVMMIGDECQQSERSADEHECRQKGDSGDDPSQEDE